MNSMMLMREDGQMGTCRICGKNFGLIGGYMEEFTGERLNVCVDCIKNSGKFLKKIVQGLELL